MKMISLTKVTCNYKWAPEDVNAEFTFASLSKAREWAKANKEDLRWDSIVAYDICPCRNDEPKGQLFYGVTYSEYWSRDKHTKTDYGKDRYIVADLAL